MAPKFPNPDPATDRVRDRLNQFIEVAGRAVYPPLAVAPSPTTPGQIWWDISDTVKIRNEANAAWDDLLAVLGGQPAGSYQPAGGYVRYDDAQALTSPQQAQARSNIGLGNVATDNVVPVSRGGTGSGDTQTARDNLGVPQLPSLTGAWLNGQVDAGGALVIPAGGQWAWMADSFSTASGGVIAQQRRGGVAAGGSTVINGQSGILYQYTFWRIRG